MLGCNSFSSSISANLGNSGEAHTQLQQHTHSTRSSHVCMYSSVFHVCVSVVSVMCVVPVVSECGE